MIAGQSNKRSSGGRPDIKDKLSSLDLPTLISIKDVHGRKIKRLIEKQIKSMSVKRVKVRDNVTLKVLDLDFQDLAL